MAPFTRNASLLMLLLHQKKSKIAKPNRQTDEKHTGTKNVNRSKNQG